MCSHNNKVWRCDFYKTYAPPFPFPTVAFALRRSATFQQPISFSIVTDRWRKRSWLATSPNKRLPSIHFHKKTSGHLNQLTRSIRQRSVDCGSSKVFRMTISSDNSMLFKNPGDTLFFSALPATASVAK